MRSLQAFAVTGILVAVSLSVFSGWLETQPLPVAMNNFIASWGPRLGPCVAFEMVASVSIGLLVAVLVGSLPAKAVAGGHHH